MANNEPKCKYLTADCEGISFGSDVLNSQWLRERARDIIFSVYCNDKCETCPVYKLKEKNKEFTEQYLKEHGWIKVDDGKKERKKEDDVAVPFHTYDDETGNHRG